jgi:hypothetical protein
MGCLWYLVVLVMVFLYMTAYVLIAAAITNLFATCLFRLLANLLFAIFWFACGVLVIYNVF